MSKRIKEAREVIDKMADEAKRLTQVLKKMAPDAPKGKKLLLSFEKLPLAWAWLEKMETRYGVSKTAIVKGLVEMAREENK